MKSIFADGGYSSLAAKARDGKSAAIYDILQYLGALEEREKNKLGVEPQYTEAYCRRSLASILKKQAKALSAQQEVEREVRMAAAEDLEKEAARAERPLVSAEETEDDKKEETRRRRRPVDYGPKC